MRILHIAELYRARYGGGAAAYVHDLCELLSSRGHDVAVLVPESAQRAPYTFRTWFDGAIEVRSLNLPYFVDVDPEGLQLGVHAWRRHQQRLVQAVGPWLEEWRPDVVIAHTLRPFGEELLPAFERRRVPVMRITHDAWALCLRLQLFRSPTSQICSGPGLVRCAFCMYSNFDGKLAALLKLPWRLFRLGLLPAYRIARRRRALNTVRSTLAHSRFMADVFRRNGASGVIYLPLGINLERLPAVQPARPRTPFRFGFMAGFQPHKGIWRVLDAAGDLAREGIAFELHVWGPGQENGPGEVGMRGIADQVRFRGIFAPEEMWAAYAEMDATVMATTWAEPFGRVVAEATAMGIPTVAPRIGGIAEQIRHGVDGLLFDASDRHDLARQMRRLLLEPGLYDHLRANLRAVRDTRAVGPELERLLQTTLEA